MHLQVVAKSVNPEIAYWYLQFIHQRIYLPDSSTNRKSLIHHCTRHYKNYKPKN